MKVWQLAYWQIATMTSSVFLGMLTGSLIWGSLSDSLGRRPTFLASAATIALFGTLSAAAIDVYTMMVCRFLVGVGVGGFTIPFDILAEFVSSGERGKTLLSVMFYWTAGSVIIPIVAWLTLPQVRSDEQRSDDLHLCDLRSSCRSSRR